MPLFKPRKQRTVDKILEKRLRPEGENLSKRLKELEESLITNSYKGSNLQKYKDKCYEITKTFTEETQVKCVKALSEMREEGFTWEFLANALTKKSKDNFERYGFGIFWNTGFRASVYQAIQREREAQTITQEDIENFFK